MITSVGGGSRSAESLRTLRKRLLRLDAPSWFHLFNIIFAVLGVFVLPFVHLFKQPARESAVAVMAVIFAIAAVLGQVAVRKVKSVALQPEIETLLGAAEAVFKKHRRGRALDLSTTISRVSLVGALLCCGAGIVIIVLPADPVRSFWSAIVAVLVGEAIYLSWCFEQAAKQTELEALALGWKATPNATLSRLWATRAIELNDALGLPRNKKPEKKPQLT